MLLFFTRVCNSKPQAFKKMFYNIDTILEHWPTALSIVKRYMMNNLAKSEAGEVAVPTDKF
jgi:hypothetical protein